MAPIWVYRFTPNTLKPLMNRKSLTMWGKTDHFIRQSFARPGDRPLLSWVGLKRRNKSGLIRNRAVRRVFGEGLPVGLPWLWWIFWIFSLRTMMVEAKTIEIFNDLVEALAKVQDEETGLWYLVLDQGKRKGNYLEASAAGMFIYAIAKGIRKGYLSENFLSMLNHAYNGFIRHLIEVGPDGTVNIKDTCLTAGLGDRPNRDGSFEYYISEPIVVNDLKGIAAFILASVEVEELNG